MLSDLQTQMFNGRDIVFTHRGNIGQVSYIPENSKFKTLRYISEPVLYAMRSQEGDSGVCHVLLQVA